MNKEFSGCTKNYPEIGQFPVSIQKLLAQDLGAIEDRMEQGKPVPEFDESLICYCRYVLRSEPVAVRFACMPGGRFARHYCLPCHHVFHLDMKSKVPTSALWQSFIYMFDELGMAVYETIGRVVIENWEQEAPRDNWPLEAVLDLRVIEEQLRQLTYVAHEPIEENWLASDG